LSWNENDEPSQQSQQPQQQKRSVGDVVQGLHGSKYQFQQLAQENKSLLGYEGQQFANEGYVSGHYPGDKTSILHSLQNEPLPDWAIAWQQQFRPVLLQSHGSELRVGNGSSSQGQPGVSITIQNEERSWEKFYTFVLLVEDEPTTGETAINNKSPMVIDASYVVRVEPRMGILAPRGKRSEDDGSFSDSVQLRICMTNNADPETAGKLWLLVGTEAERRVYKVVV
jgi:hypothetical protein